MTERVGPSVPAVARQSYALTLWTWAHLTIASRVDTYQRRSNAIDDASLAAAAFHEPKRLKDCADALADEMGLAPSASDALADAAGIVDAMKILDAAEVI